ncbi:MAG: penicillin-binding protein 2 [Pseudomonadota bacterium]|nr:penicillin-binding protein 2 [Pseudomonadota bacterium]
MTIWRYEKSQILLHRTMGLGIIFFILILVLISRLFYLQILQGDKYLLLAEKNRLSTRLTMPSRGNIYDRNGVILAENSKTFQAVLIREQAIDYKKTLSNFLQLIPLEKDEIKRIESELKFKRSFIPVRLKDNLTYHEMLMIQLNMPDLEGIQIEEGMMRLYPAGNGNTSVLGYVSLLTDKDVAGDKGNPLLDLPGYRIGRTGIEKSMEEILKGTPGVRQSEVNAFGRTVRILNETLPQSGQDITLAIDSRLQNEATKLLNKYAASAIVINIETGEILALVSTPTYDNNLFTLPISHQNWNALLNDPHRPLQNKALTGLYSPGSIFKLVVGLAGLESGVIHPEKKINCTGKTKLGNQLFHCWKHGGHGPLTFEEALMHSCDVYFYEIAQKIKPEKIIETAQKLGFGSAVGIGISGEQDGLLPTPDWKKAKHKEGWRMGDTLNLSIGQGYLMTTPIQIATSVARIASGKKVMPTLIKVDTPPSFEALSFNPLYLKMLRNGMYDVVNKQGGTAYASRLNYKGYKMAGKTATTQVRRISLQEREKGVIAQEKLPEKYRDHAIFAAFAPTIHPKYAAVVFVEHGGGGSKTAAPIMRDLMQKVLELDGTMP